MLKNNNGKSLISTPQEQHKQFQARERLANADKVDKSNSTLWQYRKTYSNQFGFCRFISPMYSHSFSLLFYFLLPSVSLSLSPSSSTKTVQLIQPAICLQSSLITHLTGFTYYWLANKGESTERKRGRKRERQIER